MFVSVDSLAARDVARRVSAGHQATAYITTPHVVSFDQPCLLTKPRL
jgi:hypothetical protein